MGDVKVSVVIPVRDDARIVLCVRSVLASGAACGIQPQVIVVDNASRPDNMPALHEFPQVQLINEPRIGAFKARNTGIRAATGEVIFLTDAACIVDPGWLKQGLDAFAKTGADIIQGFAGSLGRTAVDTYIQARYEPRFLGAAPGAAVECDTRNLAVKRAVFGALQFNDTWRRVSDTEFGLVAEHRGFKVAYWPSMHIDHQHDTELRLYLAKQVSHGWGAQRLVREMPDLRWHSGHQRQASRFATILVRTPSSRAWSKWLISLVLTAASILDCRLATRAGNLDILAATVLDKLAILLGHVLYEAGADEPWPDEVMRGHLRWRAKNRSS